MTHQENQRRKSEKSGPWNLGAWYVFELPGKILAGKLTCVHSGCPVLEPALEGMTLNLVDTLKTGLFTSLRRRPKTILSQFGTASELKQKPSATGTPPVKLLKVAGGK